MTGFKAAANCSNDTTNPSCLSLNDCMESVTTVNFEFIRFYCGGNGRQHLHDFGMRSILYEEIFIVECNSYKMRSCTLISRVHVRIYKLPLWKKCLELHLRC